MTHTDEQGRVEKRVGPILRGIDRELCGAVIDAIEIDNPDTDLQVDDQGAYIRISAPWYCRLTRESLEDALGRPFRLSDIEPNLASFAGRIDFGDDEVVWQLDREA
ncbi:MmoB/DmpM family protein [Mycolicibacter icosiumassiliensis]|uniref:MmoB/DmpM family protein n=1 Tax=Mycolicibacter icosiumassiliensis TaxID=1792835 RepID=UPI0008298B7C|nr:MmoB/DmpM family protein [Mycolicibacter icosiumassiliensis]